jgi:NAD-dependent SIR2 family protein deacetylase
MLQENIQKMKKYIKNAEAILITTGAGMGVDSSLKMTYT